MQLKNKNRFRLRNWAQLSFFFLFFLFVVLLVFNQPRLFIPFSLSYILYLVLNPLLPIMARYKVNRNYGIIGILCLMLFFLVYPFVKFTPTIKTEAENLQRHIPTMESTIQKYYKMLKVEVREKTGFEISTQYLDDFLAWGKKVSGAVIISIPKFLASLLEWILVVPLILFFLLRDSSSFKGLILRATPNSIFERFYFLSHQFNKKLGDYIFAKFVEASIIGIIITSGLMIMGVKFSILMGILAAITNVIPYVGPLIGMAPGIILALTEYGIGPQTLAIVILYLVANVVDLAIVFPILVSKIVDLHPIVVVVSVIVGSQLLGIAGMIISIPLAAALKLIFIEIYNELYSINARM